MKSIERVNLIKDIASHLQQIMVTSEIDLLLSDYGIPTSAGGAVSKRLYVQDLLKDQPNHIIVSIASDLGLSLPASTSSVVAPSQTQQADKEPNVISSSDLQKRKVFLVHGHNKEVMLESARLLERLNITPIILSEQVNKGRTLIEKFEAHAEVPYAVILLTPDDIGGTDEASLQPRARQNVILELGYFYGKLGRSHMCCVHANIEMPTDNLGVAYVPYDTSGSVGMHVAILESGA